MARSQLEPPLKPLEDMLAEANAATLAEAEAKKAMPPAPLLTDAQLEALTDDDIRRLSRNRLLRMLISCDDDKLTLPVVRELLDRMPQGGTPGSGTASGIDRIEIIIVDPKTDAMPSNLPVQQREGGTGAGGEG